LRYSLLILAAFSLIGCRQDMHDQPRYRISAASDFWSDRRSGRPAVPGTVARGMNKTGESSGYWTGSANGQLLNTIPVPVTRELLVRGRDRYNIYCTPCHGMTGYGDGIIVSRGLKNPPSYHTDALRDQPVGHFFDVITKGNGEMKSYAARIPVQDRWAIVAYLRTLQASQNVKLADLAADEVTKVRESENPPRPEAKKEAAH
jgi:mono/diheme cytochrome c family protein